MARPFKNGVDYFPLDVQLDEKFELLEAQFGIKAFAVIVKLYQKIYGGEGYYCEWDEDIALLFAQRNNVNYNVVSDILSAAVKRGIFNKKMFQDYGILTSAGIQKQYLKIITKRKQIEIKEAYWLIPDTVNSENSEKNGVNDGNNSVNDGNNAQRKGKEREKEIEKEKRNEIEKGKRKPYGEYSRVLLSDDEYDSLIDEYGEDAEAIIDFLDSRMEANGYHYNNCYLKIKEWAAEAYLKEVKPKLIKETFGRMLDEVREELSNKQNNSNKKGDL